MYSNRSFLWRFFAAVVSLGLCITANSAPYFTRPVAPTQRLFIENINLTVGDFYTAYLSPVESERRYAELYLLGVLDTSEGNRWCDYTKFLSGTLAETIFSELDKLNHRSDKERASKVIVGILEMRYPCKEKHR